MQFEKILFKINSFKKGVKLNIRGGLIGRPYNFYSLNIPKNIYFSAGIKIGSFELLSTTDA